MHEESGGSFGVHSGVSGSHLEQVGEERPVLSRVGMPALASSSSLSSAAAARAEWSPTGSEGRPVLSPAGRQSPPAMSAFVEVDGGGGGGGGGGDGENGVGGGGGQHRLLRSQEHHWKRGRRHRL